MARLDLLGHGLEVHGASPRLLAWLQDYWGFAHPVPPSGAPPVKLFYSKTAPSPHPSETPTLLRFPEGNIACIHQDPRVWLGSSECGVLLSLGDAIKLEVWGEGDAQFAQLHVALTEVLRAKGFLPLHAAVAVKGGEATAFLGESGSGKTTALLSHVREGWQALCEDFVWLEPSTLQLYRWDRGVRLLPDTAERFSTLIGKTPGAHAAGKQFFRYSDLGWAAPAGVLTKLLWLNRHETPEAKRSLSKVEATRILWEATGVPISRSARTQTNQVITDLLISLTPERLSRRAELSV